MRTAPRKGGLARRGFTMLELLIAVSISVIIVAGLYGLFIVQSQQFLFQDLRAAMHQNLRFGMDVLTRTGRMTGYGTSGYSVGPLGWEDTSRAVDSDAILPALITYNAWSGSHDAVTMVYADPALEMSSSVLVVEDCSTTSITFRTGMLNYANLISSYNTDDILICWDYANLNGTSSWLWEINSVSGGVISVSAGTFYDDYVNDSLSGCPTGENLPPILSCSKAQIATFYIDDVEDSIGPGTEEHPVLMMDLDLNWPSTDDVPLVDDIEDLQVAYCLQETDCSTEANWLLNTLGGTGSGSGGNLSNAEVQTVSMMRFTLVARSSRLDPQNLRTSAPLDIEDHDRINTEDYYYREALTSMVFVQNLGTSL